MFTYMFFLLGLAVGVAAVIVYIDVKRTNAFKKSTRKESIK